MHQNHKGALSATASPSDTGPAARLRVFLVEDSPNMQAALRELLSFGANFEVVASANSEMDATGWLLDNSAWDVASVDLMLQDGSGFNVVRRCRTQAPTKPVVVFSEFVTPAVRERCLDMGASAAFAKSEFHAYADFMDSLRNGRIPA